MQVIKFLMVSCILSSGKAVDPPNLTSQESCRKLYLDLLFRNGLSEVKQDQKSTDNSPNEYFTSANEFVNGSDDISDVNENIQKLYYRVLDLLIFRIETWLTNNERPESISNYLGFQPKIVNLINIAITELLYQQRRGRINVDNLVNAFFYSCDIKHMRDYSDNDKANITERFKTILESFEYPKSNVEKLSLCVLENNLETSISLIVNGVSPYLSITIPLMKNRMFVDESNNKIVNKLQTRFIEEYKNNVQFYEHETFSNKVIENHLNLLSKIIPDVFGFLYNHFELLIKLRKGRFMEKEVELIIQQFKFSKFLDMFMQFFIYRFVEFKREENKRFLDTFSNLIHAISALVDFIDNGTTSEKTGQLIIFQNKLMMKLIHNALDPLLGLFGNENIEEWITNRTLKIEYPDGKQNKEYLLKLMKDNSENAFEILNIFSSHFVQLLDFDKL